MHISTTTNYVTITVSSSPQGTGNYEAYSCMHVMCMCISFIDDVLLLGIIGPIILLVFAVIILIALILVVGILILCCRKNKKVATSTCCASKNVSVLHVYICVPNCLIFTTGFLCITDEKVNYYNCYTSWLCTMYLNLVVFASVKMSTHEQQDVSEVTSSLMCTTEKSSCRRIQTN